MVGYGVINIGNSYITVWGRSPKKALFTAHAPGCAQQLLSPEKNWSVDHMQVEKHLWESQPVSQKWRCSNGGCKALSLNQSYVPDAGTGLCDHWLYHRDNSWQPLGTPSLSLTHPSNGLSENNSWDRAWTGSMICECSVQKHWHVQRAQEQHCTSLVFLRFRYDRLHASAKDYS